MSKTHCLRGHDINVVGRSSQRMCRECLREWNRTRNRRRRADPAYVEAEAHYNFHYSLWRRSSLAINRRIANAPQEIEALVAQANALMPGLGDAFRFEPPPPPAWDGDPHSVHAPVGRYRSRPGTYPRITKETIAEHAAKPYIQIRRRLAGIQD